MVEAIIFITTIIASAVALWAWQFLNWVWLKPRKIERLFRKQGMKGNPYKLLVGDSLDTARMYKEAFSKPIGIHDDIIPRVMPNICQALQEHGDFCFTWAGPRPRVFIMDHNIAREILNKNQLYWKPFVANNNKTIEVLATGLGKLEGEAWRKSRSRFSPFYKIHRLWSMVPMIHFYSEVTVKELNELVAKGGGSAVVDVFPVMKNIASEILARIIVNCPYDDVIQETFRKLAELATLAHLHAKTWSFPGEKYMPTKTNRRVDEINNFVRNVFTGMINERLKSRKPKDAESDYKDLLDALMVDLFNEELSNKDRKRIIQHVFEELKGHFFGGFEPLSSLLTWILVMLSSHQNCQDHARAEVLQVLGNKDEITSNDLSNLKYVDMVVNESMRLFHPLIELSRLVSEDVTINGYTIPKDTLLTFPTMMLNRSTKYWGEDAGKFKPERFSEGKMNASIEGFRYIPFGSGPRICLGMNLALIEAKVVLAMLLRKFSFELSPTYVHAPSVNFTLLPQFGAPLVLKKL